MIGQEGNGVLVYLPQEGRGIGLAEKIKAYASARPGSGYRRGQPCAWVQGRHAGLWASASRVLKDLGLQRIRLLTNNPKKTEAFSLRSYDLEVVDQVPILSPPNKYNAHYLATKRDKLGHQIPLD